MSNADEAIEVPQPAELSAQPTAQMRVKGGELQQVFHVSRDDGSTAPEWRSVPVEPEDEDVAAPAKPAKAKSRK